jgi:cyclopropane-fatty-acyl-phospholipid synthase
VRASARQVDATLNVGPTIEQFAARLRGRRHVPPLSFSVQDPDGQTLVFGDSPDFCVRVVSARGMRALTSMSELAIAEAYIAEDIDFEGDLIAAMGLRRILRDRQAGVTAWAHLQSLLVGRKRSNPAWIAKHYDANNVQLFGLDHEYAVYTPGIYESEHDTLEAGALRKLEAAYDALRLAPGRRLLDVGTGWGGFVRFCAARGVDVHGITLSRHQLQYTQEKLREDGHDADVAYQDVFTFEPAQQFDAISMMGVLEDISNYHLILARVASWLRPGGRVYCDFASASRRFGVPSFVTKYVWPGKFRMVYLPEFVRAVVGAGLDLVELHNDKQNYFLWTKGVHERWLQHHEEIVGVADEQLWRLMRLLFAGTAEVMNPQSGRNTAYRVVLERRSPISQVTSGSQSGRRRPLELVGRR